MDPRRPLLALGALIAACHGGAASSTSTSTSTSSGAAGAGGAGGDPSFTVSVSATSSGTCGDPDGGVAGLTGCEGVDAGATFSADVAPILAQSCNGELCHVTPTYDSLVGKVAGECCDARLLVAPGDAEHSYLVDKLLGAHLCSGGRMPLSSPPLADADVLAVRRWICAGAPHD